MLKTVLKRIYRLRERTIEQLAHTNYNTAKTYYHYKLRRTDARYKKPPLLVYQMGKVGSSSVSQSLKKAKIDRHIYHVHFLRPERVAEYEEKRRDFFGTPREGDLKHIWQYQHLNEQLKHGLNGKKWKIITLVRDPVARNLSTFFENIEMIPSESGQQQKLISVEYDFEITIENNNLDGLIELFFEKCRHDTPIIYFDREFKDVLNIDLFASRFPTEKGYKIYNEKEFDILLIRLENLNNCFTEAIKEFLNIDDVLLISRNIGSQKDYANLYQMFRNSIALPESYTDKLYSSRFAKYFYSDAEIEQFRTRWSRKPIV